MFPPVMLLSPPPSPVNTPPLLLILPLTVNPVVAKVAIVLAPTPTITLPLTDGTLTLLTPFCIFHVSIVTKLRLPLPSVCITCPLLPPVTLTLPIALRLLVPVTVNVPVLALPVVVLPVTDRFVNVPTLVTLGNAVLTLNCVQFNVNTSPAVYVPAPLNCVQTILLVPITGLSVVCTQPLSAYVLPKFTNVKSPPATSALVSKSVARVNVVVFVYV